MMSKHRGGGGKKEGAKRVRRIVERAAQKLAIKAFMCWKYNKEVGIATHKARGIGVENFK
jgi:hypothetical protein